MAKIRKSKIKKDMILNFGGDIKDCADLFYAGDWEIYLDMGSIPYPLKEDSTIDYQGWLNVANSRVRGAWGNLNVSLSPVTGEYKAWLDYGRTQDERNTKEYNGTVTGLDTLHLTNDIGNMVWNDYCMLNGIEKSTKKSKGVKKGIGYSDDVAVNLQGARDYVDMAIDCLKRVPVGNQWLKDADMGIENDVSSAMDDLSYAFNSITSAMDFVNQNYTASTKKSKVAKGDLNRHIWEGWTPQDFINELEPQVDMIMRGQSYISPFQNKKELEEWCKDNQPYYKKKIPEVVNYFAEKYGISKMKKYIAHTTNYGEARMNPDYTISYGQNDFEIPDYLEFDVAGQNVRCDLSDDAERGLADWLSPLIEYHGKLVSVHCWSWGYQTLEYCVRNREGTPYNEYEGKTTFDNLQPIQMAIDHLLNDIDVDSFSGGDRYGADMVYVNDAYVPYSERFDAKTWSAKKSKPVAKKTNITMSFEDNVNKMRQYNKNKTGGI